MKRFRQRIGVMRDIVDIYKDASDATDEQQSFVGIPFIASVPAEVNHVGGNEKGQDTFIQYEVTCHYLDSITPAMEVRVKEGPFAGEVLNIGECEVIRNNGRPMWLRLHCQKVR